MTDQPFGPHSWRTLARHASVHHGAFSRAMASAAGLNARKLRSAATKGLLDRPLSDVFVFANSPDGFRRRCAVASLAGATVSHDSAAALHGLDGFAEPVSGRIHVCFPRDHKRLLPGYFVHTWSRTRPRDIATVDGIRCTSVARTLVQLGLNHDRAVVEVALDSALRKGASPRWIEETYHRLKRPGPTGHGVLGSILTDPARTGELTESLLETIVEEAISDPALPRPIRQHRIRLSSGVRRFDLAFPDALLAIEGHSRRFHFGSAADERDNLRDIEVAAAGWEVLYITWGLAHEPRLFLRFVKQTYHRRRRLFELAASG